MTAVDDHGEGTGERKRAGRPPSLGPAELAVLSRIVTEHATDSLRELTARLVRELGVEVSAGTVHRRLKDLGIVRQVAPTSAGVPADAAASPEEVAPKRYGYTEAHRHQAPEGLYPSCLTDAEWALVADVFEDKVRGMPRLYSRRLMLDAMVYVVRSGCAWRMLPKEFPPWNSVYLTFRRWSAQGRFERMYDRLRAQWREREGRAPEPTAAVIDSQSVKTSPQGGPKGFDGAKKVKGRKRHLLTDTLGLLLAVLVQTGDIQDRDGAAPLVERGIEKYPTISKLLTDGGYAGQCVVALRERHPGLDVEVVRHPANRSVGIRSSAQLAFPTFAAGRAFVPLPKRWVVERTHAWNDRPRRMAKDHDRTIRSATAWIWLTEARMLARRLTGAGIVA